jgi:putative ATP-dependent endonuclease of OLD family
VKITKIRIKNFRLLKDVSVELRDKLSLLIGRNNTGKTSFLLLMEKFLKTNDFNYDDFSLYLRAKINDINQDFKVEENSIQMVVDIEYCVDDNLEHISNFILDLDESKNVVKLLFECTINKDKLLKDIEANPDIDKKRFIRKSLNNYIDRNVYAFISDDDVVEGNRNKLVKKEVREVLDVINFQVIHAKRDVASSESCKNVLSKLTTQYFNQQSGIATNFEPINKLINEMDEKLEDNYEKFFSDFLKNAKDFFKDLRNLKVLSNLQSKELFENSSQVVYGELESYLPENYNGLGYLNMLYLLLHIEIKKQCFAYEGKDINLLFIEEPEAHTHPQMQYIFAKKVKTILKDLGNLQTVISSHSSHIVSQCDFEDIRYLVKGSFKSNEKDYEQVIAKNFHNELRVKYKDEPELFQFLEQYLSLQFADLFFADKIIFIEGISERILLPYFIQLLDKENSKNEGYVSLMSQNLSVVEVGANAKTFRHFIDFLDVQTLIITDIDTTKEDKSKDNKTIYIASPVAESTHTSNATVRYYLKAPDFGDANFSSWFNDLKKDKLKCENEKIKLCNQVSENNYHARSFEDAFISINTDIIKNKIDKLQGLKNKDDFNTVTNFYELTAKVIDKKSDFASSLLFEALSDDKLEWKIPKYIKDGLQWISQN